MHYASLNYIDTRKFMTEFPSLASFWLECYEYDQMDKAWQLYYNLKNENQQ